MEPREEILQHYRYHGERDRVLIVSADRDPVEIGDSFGLPIHVEQVRLGSNICIRELVHVTTGLTEREADDITERLPLYVPCSDVDGLSEADISLAIGAHVEREVQRILVELKLEREGS